jgi:hypothetical protein
MTETESDEAKDAAGTSDDTVDVAVPPGEAARPAIKNESELQPSDLIADSALDDAERDEFSHREIADRIAELAALADLPVNIALFGPWGSGKTSLFNLIEMTLESDQTQQGSRTTIKTIRYDAWKFGGASLKRNFVAEAAEHLNLAKDDFRQTLYENVSFIRLPLRAFWVSNWRRTLLTVLTFLGVAFAAVLGWTLYDHWFANVTPNGPDPGFWDILRDHAEYALRLSIASAIPVVGGLRLLESARVTVSRDAPSQDEEFESEFHKLIDKATTKTRRWKWRDRIASSKWLSDKDSDHKPGMSDEDLDHARRRKAWVRKKVAGPLRWDRIMFFVDELDRCAPGDVLSTLIGVKTFLEHKKCVFVVAADRDVLVEALEVPTESVNSTRQVTPLREDQPYYSTAGAFIDKMFQFQIDLPPLRRHALTTFAKRVVAGHSDGIWSDLKNDNKLDDVIWTLIPLHVRSPRRIKVLLNNFATTARIASAREIDWQSKPVELAKLTVLRTEFPRFVQDLLIEPSLVRHLQKRRPPEVDASEGLLRLYRKYAIDFSPQEVEASASPPADSGEDDDATTPRGAPTPLAETAGPASTAELAATEEQAAEFTTTGPDTAPRRATLARAELTYRRQLDQYLEKAAFAGAVGPNRALLYMENVGNREGLSDPDLSDAIDDAPDRAPEVTIAAFEDKPEDAAIAIPILSGEVSDQVDPGKQVLVTVICGLAERLNSDQLEQIAGEAAAAVEPVFIGPLGKGAMTAGAIAITNSTRSRTDPAASIERFGHLVATTSIEDEEELDLAAVNLALEFLEEPYFSALCSHLAAAFHKGMSGIESGLTELSNPIVHRLWDQIADSVFRRIQEVETESEAAASELPEEERTDEAKVWFTSVVDSLQDREEKAENLVIDAFARGITISGSIYTDARAYAEQVGSRTVADGQYGTLAALGIRLGPTTDWTTWSTLLGDGKRSLDPTVASAAIRRVLGEVDAADTDSRAAAYELIERLNTAAVADDELASIVELLEEALTANPWTTTGELPIRQFNDEVVERLAGHNPAIADLYQPVRAADIVEALQSQSANQNFTEQVIAYIRNVPAAHLPALLEQFDSTYPDYPTTSHGMRLHTHLKTLVPNQSPFPVDALTGLTHDALLDAIVDDWLRLNPPPEDLVALAESGYAIIASESLGEYVQRLTDAERALVWSGFRVTGVDDDVLIAVAAPGVTLTVAEPFLKEALSPVHHDVRKEAVSTLATLPLGTSPLIGEASETIYKLVQTQRSGDVKLAAELAIKAEDIKGGHKGDVKKIFDANRGRFSTKQKVALTAFKMLSPRKSIADRVDEFRGIFRS